METKEVIDRFVKKYDGTMKCELTPNPNVDSLNILHLLSKLNDAQNYMRIVTEYYISMMDAKKKDEISPINMDRGAHDLVQISLSIWETTEKILDESKSITPTVTLDDFI